MQHNVPATRGTRAWLAKATAETATPTAVQMKQTAELVVAHRMRRIRERDLRRQRSSCCLSWEKHWRISSKL